MEAEAGRLDGARAIMQPLVEDNVVGARASRHLADILRQEEEFVEAVDYYKIAEQGLNNPDWRFYFTKGIALEQSQNWAEAEQAFQKSLTLNPGEPVVMNYLAYSWIDRDINLERALEMVAEAADKRPQDGYIIDSLAWAHFKLGNYDEALRLMERAHELAPTDPTIAEHHGDVLEKLGHVREAVFMWKRALKRFEDDKDRNRVREKIERLAED
jgi:Flp pilus assembly protein TadD